jgi:hypothetical protein
MTREEFGKFNEGDLIYISLDKKSPSTIWHFVELGGISYHTRARDWYLDFRYLETDKFIGPTVRGDWNTSFCIRDIEKVKSASDAEVIMFKLDNEDLSNE